MFDLLAPVLCCCLVPNPAASQAATFFELDCELRVIEGTASLSKRGRPNKRESNAIERNTKFGFLFPMMSLSGTSFISSKSVELTQTPIIYVRTNIETNIYNSNQSTKILTFFGYSQTINDVSAGTFTYENKNQDYIRIQTTDIQTLEIELLDINLNVLDLNSMPVSIELDLKYD